MPDPITIADSLHMFARLLMAATLTQMLFFGCTLFFMEWPSGRWWAQSIYLINRNGFLMYYSYALCAGWGMYWAVKIFIALS